VAGNSNPVTPPPPADPSVVTMTVTLDKVTRIVTYNGPLGDWVTLLGMLEITSGMLHQAREREGQDTRRVLEPPPLTRRF